MRRRKWSVRLGLLLHLQGCSFLCFHSFSMLHRNPSSPLVKSDRSTPNPAVSAKVVLRGETIVSLMAEVGLQSQPHWIPLIFLKISKWSRWIASWIARYFDLNGFFFFFPDWIHITGPLGRRRHLQGPRSQISNQVLAVVRLQALSPWIMMIMMVHHGITFHVFWFQWIHFHSDKFPFWRFWRLIFPFESFWFWWIKSSVGVASAWHRSRNACRSFEFSTSWAVWSGQRSGWTCSNSNAAEGERRGKLKAKWQRKSTVGLGKGNQTCRSAMCFSLTWATANVRTKGNMGQHFEAIAPFGLIAGILCDSFLLFEV